MNTGPKDLPWRALMVTTEAGAVLFMVLAVVCRLTGSDWVPPCILMAVMFIALSIAAWPDARRQARAKAAAKALAATGSDAERERNVEMAVMTAQLAEIEASVRHRQNMEAMQAKIDRALDQEMNILLGKEPEPVKAEPKAAGYPFPHEPHAVGDHVYLRTLDGSVLEYVQCGMPDCHVCRNWEPRSKP